MNFDSVKEYKYYMTEMAENGKYNLSYLFCFDLKKNNFDIFKNDKWKNALYDLYFHP